MDKSFLSKEKVIEILETVMDPEIGIDVWTMGLIYDISIKEKEVFIKMTLTSPTCPLGDKIQNDIKTSLLSIGFTKVDIVLTFDPPWQIPDGLRNSIGI